MYLKYRSTVNITFNGETLETFPLKPRTRQEHPPSAVLLNMTLKALTSTVNKMFKDLKRGYKILLYAYNMTVNIEKPNLKFIGINES